MSMKTNRQAVNAIRACALSGKTADIGLSQIMLVCQLAENWLRSQGPSASYSGPGEVAPAQFQQMSREVFGPEHANSATAAAMAQKESEAGGAALQSNGPCRREQPPVSRRDGKSISALMNAAPPAWECAARRQGTAGGVGPADCDWPFCGCDPHANKVLETLEECGFLSKKQASASYIAVARLENDGRLMAISDGTFLSEWDSEEEAKNAIAVHILGSRIRIVGVP